jgi:hypothetical protein
MVDLRRPAAAAQPWIRMPHLRTWRKTRARTRRSAHPAALSRTISTYGPRTSREVAQEDRNFDADRFTLRVASRRRRNPNVVVEARYERPGPPALPTVLMSKRPARCDIRRPLKE